MILMNYAIHYLCDDISKIEELHRLVVSLLKPRGLFIFTCFDGDEILDIILNNQGKVSSFTIELTDKKALKAKMPLPTIDASGYREEPLAVKSKLKPFFESRQLKPIKPYSPLEFVSKLPQYSNIVDKHRVADFLKHIKVYAFQKL